MRELFASFKAQPGLVAAISTREEGSMSVANWPELPREVVENRKKALQTLNINPEDTIALRLIHSARVERGSRAESGKALLDLDGIIGRETNLFFTITVADCLPVFLFDPETKAVGLIHAGWRGLRDGIVTNGVRAFSDLVADPKKVIAGIGPGIGPCHFEVGKPLREIFKEYGAERYEGPKIFLDLKKIAQTQLERAGVLSANIEISPDCTTCSSEYFSFRRDKPPVVEPMMAVIGIRNERVI